MSSVSEKYFNPAPKPEPKKKASGKKSSGKATAPSSKTVAPRTNTPDGAFEKPSTTERSRINRNFGKSTERSVAKLVGGERTPGSGAIKQSNRNLTGDVEVRDATGRHDFLKIEVKGTGKLTPKGDRSFTLHKAVLDQMVREASQAGEIGALFIHWKNNDYTDDYVIIQSDHFAQLVEFAKLGVAYEKGWLHDEPDR